MATIKENIRQWDKDFDWEKEKPEWVHPSPGSDLFWYFGLYPRCRAFLPTDTILEIAPGHGRWTHYLKDYCRQLVVVDLAEKCIQACRQRFATLSNIQYHVNDGKSLDCMDDESVDFCFSFDSLVHCDSDVMQAYLNALSRKLKPDGVAFLHHSNVAACTVSESAGDGWRARLTKRLNLGSRGKNSADVLARGWRGRDVSAQLIESLCAGMGLCCITQESISWNSAYLIDTMTTLTRKGSRWASPNQVILNPDFLSQRTFVHKQMRPYAYEWRQTRAGSRRDEQT